MSLIRKIALKLLGVDSVLELAAHEVKGKDLEALAASLSLDALTNLTVKRAGAQNFGDLAQKYLVAETERSRVLTIEIHRLVRKYTAGARINEAIENIAVRALVSGVAGVEASQERNILKRKSAAMQVVKAQMPGIGKAESNYAVELILQLVKESKVV